ncbi:prefoldin subunit alpha [Candidatus Pacearchaeota archaeon]|nr:prefoldin subunit alpha [Candidatus Pacearchaeota archaeon]
MTKEKSPKEQGDVQQVQQEMMMKLQMFEQQAQQIQQQLQAVEGAIGEMMSLNIGLEELKGSEGKEIMAPMGRGIFVKTKLLSEDLVVDVGGKNFVKKSIDDTKELIEGQTKKLEGVKSDLEKNMDMLRDELEGIMGQGPQ